MLEPCLLVAEFLFNAFMKIDNYCERFFYITYMWVFMNSCHTLCHRCCVTRTVVWESPGKVTLPDMKGRMEVSLREDLDVGDSTGAGTGPAARTMTAVRRERLRLQERVRAMEPMARSEVTILAVMSVVTTVIDVTEVVSTVIVIEGWQGWG